MTILLKICSTPQTNGLIVVDRTLFIFPWCLWLQNKSLKKKYISMEIDFIMKVNCWYRNITSNHDSTLDKWMKETGPTYLWSYQIQNRSWDVLHSTSTLKRVNWPNRFRNPLPPHWNSPTNHVFFVKNLFLFLFMGMWRFCWSRGSGALSSKTGDSPVERVHFYEYHILLSMFPRASKITLVAIHP